MPRKPAARMLMQAEIIHTVKISYKFPLCRENPKPKHLEAEIVVDQETQINSN